MCSSCYTSTSSTPEPPEFGENPLPDLRRRPAADGACSQAEVTITGPLIENMFPIPGAVAAIGQQDYLSV